MTRNFAKIALLAAAMATTPIFTAVQAETVELMILNTRGEDGIYRPALRIVRGGTVTFVAAGTQGLTEATLRDNGLLAAWLGENVPNTDPNTPITFVVTEVKAGASAGGAKDCVEAYNSGGETCTPEEAEAYCARTATSVLSTLAGPPRDPITRGEFCSF